MRTLKLAVLYFLAVFAAGFVLGVLRTLWVAPRVGELAAEVIEAPLMLGAMVAVARSLVGRCPMTSWRGWLSVGLIAAVLLLLAEVAGLRWLRQVSIRDYFAARHGLATALYFTLVGVFAAMPAVLSKRRMS